MSGLVGTHGTTGAAADLNVLISTLQAGNQISSAILQQLKTGVLLSPSVSVYTVAALPTSATNFAIAAASNGRKPGEGPGVGTGVPVFWNPATSQWFSFLSGVVVTA